MLAVEGLQCYKSRMTTALTTKMAELEQTAKQIVAAGVPENTRRTYRSQWQTFLVWCREHDQPSLPTTGSALVLFLTDRSREVKVSSLNVALAAITVAHRESGLTDWAASDLPGVRVFMRGLRRQKGKPPKKKEPLRFADLVRGLPQGEGTKAVRDRAILLLGFFSAMRRSEIAGLELDDVKFIPQGLRVMVRNSKTDKNAEGQTIVIPELDNKEVCPVQALRAWLDLRQAPSEALFVSLRSGLHLPDQAIARIVKAAAKRAGFNPRDFGAHSLRAGFATSAAEVEAEERDIMRVTRHRSERTVREYIHEGQAGSHHPGKKIAEVLS